MTMPENTPAVEQAELPPRTRWWLLASLAVAVGALVVFAWLADQILEGQTRHFDLYVRLWAHHFAAPGLPRAMAIISRLGSALFLVVATALLVLRFLLMRWRRAAVWLALAMAGAVVLDLTLKLAFRRPRPVAFFGVAPDSYSFPSGHALASMCFYGVLAGLLTARVRSPRLRVLLWLAAALLIGVIGFSRIYLGVHYPTDVVAGYLAAAVWVGALVFADRVRRLPRVPPAPD
jgi:undecaprenyl-diphosphatase